MNKSLHVVGSWVEKGRIFSVKGTRTDWFYNLYKQGDRQFSFSFSSGRGFCCSCWWSRAFLQSTQRSKSQVVREIQRDFHFQRLSLDSSPLIRKMTNSSNTSRGEGSTRGKASKLDRLRQVLSNTRAIEICEDEKLTQHSEELVGIQAFIVASEDAHQSEYVSEADKRREFISGFNGSYGTVVITQSEALLWTDGRYFLQAEQQLDLKSWTLMKSGGPGVPKLEEWCARHLKRGDRVGIDPFLTSVSSFRKMRHLFAEKGILLVCSIDQANPVDLVWDDQPFAATSSIQLLGEEFTGCKLSEKLTRVRSKLVENDAVGIMLTALDDIAWLFNIRAFDIPFNPVCIAYAFVSLDRAILFVDPSKLNAETRSTLEKDIEVCSYDSVLDTVDAIVAQNPGKIMLDPNQCNMAVFNVFPKAQRLEAQSLILKEKTTKNETELEGMRQCHIRDGAALVRFFAWLENEMKSGNTHISEVDAANKQITFREQVQGFVSLSFDTISSVGSNGAIIHYKPTASNCKTLTMTDLYLNDSGGQYFDGTTDVTRTLHFGTPTLYEKECFTRVLQGHIALATAVFPDETEGSKLDTIARGPLWQAGLDYNHGTGHGVGAFLNVHEKGILLSCRHHPSNLPIGPNMVLSNEPGYYEEGAFGIRIESVMISKEATHVSHRVKKFLSFETITAVPIQKNLIEKKLLSKEEIQWVNDYHKDVFAKLSPLLCESDAFEYLVQETSPL